MISLTVVYLEEHILSGDQRDISASILYHFGEIY